MKYIYIYIITFVNFVFLFSFIVVNYLSFGAQYFDWFCVFIAKRLLGRQIIYHPKNLSKLVGLYIKT